MDGFVAALQQIGQRLRAPARRLPVPAGTTRAGRAARHHGLPHRPGDPELLGVREALRRCRTTCSRRSDSWTLPVAPVPRVGVVRDVPGPRRRDELPFGPGASRRERGAARPQMWMPADGAPRPYVWADITWLLHEHHVSWAYYVGPATCVVPPCDADCDGSGDRARAEPAARVQDRRGRPPASEHPVERALLRRGRSGHAARRCRGSCRPRNRSEHPPDNIGDGAGVGHEGRQRRDARDPTGSTPRSSSRGTTGAASTIT